MKRGRTVPRLDTCGAFIETNRSGGRDDVCNEAARRACAAFVFASSVARARGMRARRHERRPCGLRSAGRAADTATHADTAAQPARARHAGGCAGVRDAGASAADLTTRRP
ncbi:putative 2-dehydropantoate 2-reductase [Burkholderia mallei]|nr:putative 2-dehydropantoate 2-reductase [Burkholderia mallei]